MYKLTVDGRDIYFISLEEAKNYQKVLGGTIKEIH